MSKKDIAIKISVEISRILLGITFTFSGFVKAVDPLGFTYKIQDYITAFGLDFLYPLALPTSIAMCTIEFSVGVCMLFGIYRRWSSRIILAIMLFMTPLTLYLAIANPVSDCGCFGDAWIITNWQTFYKNIVLLICAVITFVYREKITNLYTGKFYWLVALYIIFYGIAFSLYNYYTEPVFDFRPYKIGANLPQLMNMEEGQGAVYENIFIYEKDGVQKEFTEDNYPWQDSTWIFVDRINKLIKEGEEPAITDFEINRLYYNSDKTDFEEEENITDEVLEDDNYTFLMIAYSLDKMRDTYISNFEDVNNYAEDYGYNFYCLTSSTTQDILDWSRENSIYFDFCLTDSRTLKTMIRSNPGLILLKNGMVINKWTDSQVPSEEHLTNSLEKLSFGTLKDQQEKNRKSLFVIVTLFLAPLILLTAMDIIFYRRKPLKQ